MSSRVASRHEGIARVNTQFLQHWKWVVEHNPKIPHPTWTDVPELVSVEVGEITHRFGTEAEIVAHFKSEEKGPYELRGAYFSTYHDSGVTFTSTPGQLVGTKEEEMLKFLFGELCYGTHCTTGPEDWKNLSP